MAPHVYNPFFSPEQNALLAQLNYDESKVAPFEVPPALVCLDGETADSPDLWNTKRRPELLELFERHLYGRMMPKLPIHAAVVEESDQALSGRATRRQVRISFPGHGGPVLNLALYLPNHAKQRAPCFLGLNFQGNHAAFDDPAIELSTSWMRAEQPGVVNHRSTEASRGTGVSRWPVTMLIDRGYALATVYYGDIEPDHPGGFAESVRSMFLPDGESRKGDEPGAITAWAWGLSRIMDYLETVEAVDSSRVCLTGHSRLGKTSLWAGANDSRFALVVSNNSGSGGAALNRRNFGENLHILSNVRPYWFCENALTGFEDANRLPIDQHLLIGLIAPRPVFVSSANDDHPANPLGEFLSCLHANEVYRLLGADGFAAREMPELNQPVQSRIGYSIRPGGHDITPDDWKFHLDFADLQLGRPSSAGG